MGFNLLMTNSFKHYGCRDLQAALFLLRRAAISVFTLVRTCSHETGIGWSLRNCRISSFIFIFYFILFSLNMHTHVKNNWTGKAYKNSCLRDARKNKIQKENCSVRRELKMIRTSTAASGCKSA